MAADHDHDEYRKPSPGMWNYFITKCNDGKAKYVIIYH
jgi:histidinol phosphatase-like enzyme